MGIQVITQPQTFKNNAVVVGAAAGSAAVGGLTVYGDISASGTIYGTGVGGGTAGLNSYSFTGNGGTTYAITNYTTDTAANYLVFLDGVKQIPTGDYTISSGNIVFASAVPSGTKVEVDVATSIVSLSANVLNSLADNLITSNGGSTYTLTNYSTNDATQYLVYVNGLKQRPGSDYTVSGSSIVFSLPYPVNGAKIEVMVASNLATRGTTGLPTGTDGQVLTYNSSTASWVPSAAPAVGLGTIVLLQDRKSAGTPGGAPVSDSWQTRTLNTKVADAANLCTLNSNQFTLSAGTYQINASAPGYMANQHIARLYNITDNTTTCLGTSEYCWNGTTSYVQTRSHITNVFTIATSKTFEVQHYIKTTAGGSTPLNGLGFPSSATGIAYELYTTVMLVKIA